MVIPRRTATLTVCGGFFLGLIAGASASTSNQVLLPVEIAGDAGTSVSVTVHVPPRFGKQIRSFWMQVHGLAYAGMVSVRINRGPWWSLNNETVTVAEPGKSYGGIGGGFATLKITLPLPDAIVVDDSNTIQFRFDRTNGIVSGFRVLAFNFLAADGQMILPPETFAEEDPNAWTPPFSDPDSISAGQRLWEQAQLTASSLPGAPAIHAHCSDCHAQDGRDLKYFNFSNLSIVARSRFHGLSEFEGRQIASYIRALHVPNPGRPWNPPYQPGPGLHDLSAGAGLAWALDDDIDTLPFLVANKAAFHPDSDLNPREVPIAFQLPDWNHWLPRVHPLDFREAAFKSSAFSQLYRNADALPSFFDKWSKSRTLFLTPHLSVGSNHWTPELAEAFYSAQLWQLVKTWELTRQFNPGNSGAELKTIPAAAAPVQVGIPNGASGMGGRALTNEYFNNAWYEVQIIANSGNHRHHGRSPVDWVYIAGHFRDLQWLSGRPKPGRLLVAVVKAMQSTDPMRSIDPRIMVDKEWAPVFRTIPEGMRRAITESLLSAWLDKTSHQPASYFERGPQPAGYKLPTYLLNISGGRVWEASPEFQAAGVRPALIERLDAWGNAYTALAELFHY